MNKQREKDIEEALRLMWSSMESHLAHTYSGDTQKFDKECVKEYARMMVLLANLY